jgi:hypothetical protein
MLCATVSTVLLAACDVAIPDSRGDCPNVQGLFSLLGPEERGGQFSLLGTFMSVGISPAFDNPWLAVRIEGNASTVLSATYLRAPHKAAARRGDPSTPAYIRRALDVASGKPDEFEKQTVTLVKGTHYECRGGWLVAAKGQPAVRIRRDAGGDLEGYLIERTPRVISVWAETGAGIPYWFDDKRRNANWRKTSMTSLLPSNTANEPTTPPPRPSGGIAQQEWDLTYGSGPVAGQPRSAAARSETPYDAQKEIRARVDRDAVVESIRQENGRYVVTLRVQSRGEVLRTLENLRGDAAMLDVQDHGIVSGGNRQDIATISMRIFAPR